MARRSSLQAVADFLKGGVGEGNTFTMQDLRDAVPGFEQIDRRVRDLRAAGWTIHSPNDDPSLPSGQYRLVAASARLRPPGRSISGRTRREVLDQARNRCQVCGVGAGEPYPDEPDMRARLQIGHQLALDAGGTSDPGNLRAECSRCNEAIRSMASSPIDAGSVAARIRALPRRDRATLARWMSQERREYTRLEDLWAEFRQLPPSAQQTIVEDLGSSPSS